ncbi:MAG: hypothetical protein V1857_02635 [archaeon]
MAKTKPSPATFTHDSRILIDPNRPLRARPRTIAEHAKATLKKAIVVDGRATRFTMTSFEPQIMADVAIMKYPLRSLQVDRILLVTITTAPFGTLVL